MGGFSAILGDLGRVEYSYDPDTGVNSFAGLTSSQPQLGGDDRIELSSGAHLVIAGGGSDEVEGAFGARVEMGLGRIELSQPGGLEFFRWRLLASPEDLGTGTLLIVNGTLIEEWAVTLPASLGNLREP
jgi:hypothetical protein